MNAFVIIGQRHGSDKHEQIGGLIIGADAREKFMPYRTKKTDPDFQRVWLCELNSERDERFSPEAVETKAEKKTLFGRNK